MVITGSSTYGVNNHGDDAMLATLVQGVKRIHHNPEITFLCRHPDQAFDQAFGFQSLKNLDHDSKESARGKIFWGMNAGDPTVHLNQIAEAIQKADLLIIGGNSLMEIFPNGFLSGVSSYAATLATLAKFFETPFVLYGLNVVDSMRQQTTKDHARFLVENAKLVTCREESCRAYLAELDIDCSNVFVMGDPAYGIELPPNFDRSATKKYAQKLGSKPVVGVAFRYNYWVDNDSMHNEMGKNFATLLDGLIQELDCKVLMIPNCTYTKGHPWQDDRVVHKEVYDYMQLKGETVCVDDDLSVFDALDLFSLVDLHISNRRHSCIFAALNDKPFIALEGLFPGHMRPFTQDLGVEDRLCAIDNVAEVTRKAMVLWQNKGYEQKEPYTNMRELQVSAKIQIDQILKTLQ